MIGMYKDPPLEFRFGDVIVTRYDKHVEIQQSNDIVWLYLEEARKLMEILQTIFNT